MCCNAMKIYVDFACNILYASYYIGGLFQLYGCRKICSFSNKFLGLHYSKDTHVFVFIHEGRKFVIDFADSNEVFYLDFCEWADVYGKVNYKLENIPVQYKDKITPVGCNFAINYSHWNKYYAALYGLMNYFTCYWRLSFDFQTYLSRYLVLSKRNKFESEEDLVALGDIPYIFFQTRWWNGQAKVNEQRAMFIRVCKELDKKGIIAFEGGMVPDVENYEEDYEDIITGAIPYEDYVAKTEKSLLVFNAPAYFDCHGWKLPEYMSMGKIILSTPFVNRLPIDMVHEKEIYYVEPTVEAMRNSILHIVNDPNLQKQLKEGVRKYWERYASPSACMNHFINGEL